MPRGKVEFVRVIESPDGDFRHVRSKNGREITGLKFHKTSERYYTLKNGTRHYLGRDITAAVFEIEGIKPETTPEILAQIAAWAELDGKA